MTDLKLTFRDVLFVGLGASAVSWYRTTTPALALGCDWIGGRGEPGEYDVYAALTTSGSMDINWYDYKIVVLQQPYGPVWLEEINRLRADGVVVLYEVDDYLHSIRRVDGHPAQARYSKKLLVQHEICMRACDGMIVSTEYLATRYRAYNRNVWVCRNAIDTDRYSDFVIPPRDTLNIGWAGGGGHNDAVLPWLPAVGRILWDYPNTRFVTIGAEYADLVGSHFPGRTVSIVGASIENWPAVLTHFDIALAPAGRSDFFRAKSDLRWLEAAALRLPVVADPFVYTDVRDGETGLFASTQQEAERAIARLVQDPDLRRRIGACACDYVRLERDVDTAVREWEAAFVESYARRMATAAHA